MQLKCQHFMAMEPMQLLPPFLQSCYRTLLAALLVLDSVEYNLAHNKYEDYLASSCLKSCEQADLSRELWRNQGSTYFEKL